MPDATPTTYPSLLPPSLDPGSLQKSILRLNEVVEMITGQRGPAEYSLQEGMISIRKSLTVAGATITASIRELNEVLVAADKALAQRTTIIEAEIVGARGGQLNLAARITEVNTARIDGDAVLAASILTLETTVGNNTAILTVQQASINGLEVRYSVTGFINGVTGGFVFSGVQRNDGGAVFTTEFFSNVIIHGSLLVTGTVDNPQITANAVSNMSSASGTVGAGGLVQTGLTVRAGASVHVSFAASSQGTLGVMAFTGAAVMRIYNIFVDGFAASTHYSYDVCAGVVYGGGSSYTFYSTVAPISGGITISGLAAGTHFFSVVNPSGVGLQMDIVAVELAK